MSNPREAGQHTTKRTLVLGIGNTLLSDEGAGIHAVRQLQSTHGDLAAVDYLDGGTLSFTLAGPIEDCDGLIVIDAAQLGSGAGTVATFVDDDMDRFLNGPGRRSVHEVGLLDLMHIARLMDRLPARRALVGIQPELIDWGECPSAAVQAAIPVACNEVITLIRRWQT